MSSKGPGEFEPLLFAYVISNMFWLLHFTGLAASGFSDFIVIFPTMPLSIHLHFNLLQKNIVP